MKDRIFSGRWGSLHCQGMSMDTEKKYIYYSFTTKLVKTDIDGNIIGSVSNIIGHLGCIDFCDGDKKVYASLEYKNDSIGRGILRELGIGEENLEDGFYIAIFDVDKIDRLDMDAEKDGIMRAVYLETVLKDYRGKTIADGKETEHIHGCSGIDGLAIGPDFGAKDGKKYLHVCYGVYGDISRTDNDYQVILQYDAGDWWELGKPLSQNALHKIGPKEPRNKYFVYTGNTEYGIQNLEYDESTGDYFACVYRGGKAEFPNYDMFRIDGSISAKTEALRGTDKTEKVLSLKGTGIYFPFGSMGVYSMGNGDFYFVDPDFTDYQNLGVYTTLFHLEENGDWWRFERKTVK